MTKKLRILSLISSASILAVPVVIASCSAKEPTKTPENPGTPVLDKLNTTENKKIVVGNVVGTLNQVSGVLKGTLSGLAKTKSIVESDSNKKSGFEAFEATLKGIAAKLESEGDLVTKIKALSETATDLGTKLDALITEFKQVVTDVETAYKTYYKVLDSTATDEKISTSYRKLEDLKTFFAKYNDVAVPNPTLLDLARLFEAFQVLVEGVVDSQGKADVVATSSDTTKAESKEMKVAKTVTQIFLLLVKRELQTLAMAKVVVAPSITDAMLIASFAKQNVKLDPRLAIAKLPTEFLTKITALEAKYTEISTLLSSANENEKTKLASFTTKFEQFKKRYFGFEENTTEVPAFAKAGLKTLTSKLDKELKSISSEPITTLEKFNKFFQVASPTWASAAGLYVNASNSIKDLEELEKLLTEDSSSAKTSSSGTSGTEVEKSTTDSLKEKITNLKTEFTALTSLTKNEDATKEVSTWKLNQNIRSISSLAQLYLLQAAVDNLTDVSAEDVALADLTAS